MKKIILLSVIALVVLIGCENPFWSNGANKQPTIEDTPIVYTYDDEAALMAMWYYDFYTAPDSISQKIYDDMSLIDSFYKDSMQVSNSYSTSERIKFWTPWQPSILYFTFDSLTVQSIKDSTHGRFYEILDSLGTDSFKVFYITSNGTPYGKLYLSGLKNPNVEKAAFNNIVEIKNMWTAGYLGDKSNIYPYFEDDTQKYFYTVKWGDCNAGCGIWHTYYFEIKNNAVIYHGNYLDEYDTTVVAPPWNDTLMIAYKKWYYTN